MLFISRNDDEYQQQGDMKITTNQSLKPAERQNPL